MKIIVCVKQVPDTSGKVDGPCRYGHHLQPR